MLSVLLVVNSDLESEREMGKTVVGLGELLWDMFPSGKKLGGAPLNFAYHCHQLGAQGYPVSAVGADELGREILAVVASKEIPGQYVAELDTHPTGIVEVALDDNGKPEYVIKEGVAWDFIPECRELDELARQTDAVCFGSLAQRNAVSRWTIDRFLASMRSGFLKIFDVNLRQQFYTKSILQISLGLCNVLKLSDEELPVITELMGISGTIEERLRTIVELLELKLIAYTRGSEGSLLVSASELDDHPGYPSEVANTVGAGDSFTAALCMGMLKGNSLSAINDQANRVAAYVCSKDTATPELPSGLVQG